MIPSIYIAGFMIAFAALSFGLPSRRSVDKDDRLEYLICNAVCSAAWPLLLVWFVWRILSFLWDREDADFKD